MFLPWHMVLDCTTPTNALLSADECQIVVVEGRYKWRTPYLVILLTYRTFILDTSGQSPFWYNFSALPPSGPAVSGRLLNRSWHILPHYLSLGPIVLFSVWKIIPPPSYRSQKEFISFKRNFRRCCITGLDKSSLITFIVPLTQQSDL